MNRSAQDIQQYVTALELPAARASRGPAAAPKVTFKQEPEAIAVGAQLTGFSDAVPADLRPLISNSMLLAQLAADKATQAPDSVLDWHTKYLEVLKNVGWKVADSEEKKTVANDKDLTVHKAIIPVITAMLGPAVAAASMVVTVLNNLQDMDKDTPWITLFDQQSQRASGAKFQVSHVDSDGRDSASIKLLSCTIDAKKKVTQVLFFKLASQHATLRQRESVLTTERAVLEIGKASISAKVGGFINDFVANIEI